MAIQNTTEELKKQKQKSSKKEFSKNNSKSKYYSNIGKMAQKKRPNPKFSPKQQETPKDETVESEKDDTENKKQSKGFIDTIYDQLINQGYIPDINDYSEEFDEDLYDKVGRNKSGDSPNSNYNRTMGIKGKDGSANISRLEKPLASINKNIETQNVSFKVLLDETTKQTKTLENIEKSIVKIKLNEITPTSDRVENEEKNTDMLRLLKNLYKTKKEEFSKKIVDKTKSLQPNKKIASFGERVKNYSSEATKKLGDIGSQIRAVAKTITTVSQNALSNGLGAEGSSSGFGSKLMLRAAIPALGVAAAGAAGYGAGSLIYKGIEGTSVGNAIGAGMARTAAFFGDEEAKKAVEDTEKYKDFGALAGQMESNNNASAVSSGKGDAGGKSYGIYQLSSKQGSVDSFLKSSGYADKFGSAKVGSAEFDAKWKELAKNDPEFAKAQHRHATKEYYAPTELGLKKEGIDLSGRGRAVKEVMLSTGVQYGASSKGSVDLIKKALHGRDVGKMSDKEIIEAIQNYKAATVDKKFRSSSAEVRQGVANRIEKEKKIALALDEKEKKTGDSKTAEVKPAVKTDSKTAEVKPSGKTVAPIPVEEYNAKQKDKRSSLKITSLDETQSSINGDKKPLTITDDNGEIVKLTDSTIVNGNINGKHTPIPNFGQLYDLEQQNRIKPFDKDTPKAKRLDYLKKAENDFNSNTHNTQADSQQASQTISQGQGQLQPVQQTTNGGGAPGTKGGASQLDSKEKGSGLLVRNQQSTIQRIMDKDFHLSV